MAGIARGKGMCSHADQVLLPGMRLSFAVVLLSIAIVRAAEPAWPQFRGANCQGIAADGEKPPVEFGPEKSCRWKTAVPPGISSPCVWGDRIFLTAAEDDKLLLLGIDRMGGKILWRHEVPCVKPESLHKTNNAAAATPATDGKRVYAYQCGFGLVACDFDGREVWRHPLETPLVVNGSGTSPALAGGKLILACDQQGGKSFLLAVDPETGRQIWKTPRPEAVSAYTTPVVWRRGETEEVIVSGSLRVTAYSLTDGAERWSAGGLEGVSVCPTPVIGDGRIYLASRSFGGKAPSPAASAGMMLADSDQDGKLSRKEAPFLEKDGAFDFIDRDHDGFASPAEVKHAGDWIRGGDFGLFALKDPGDSKGPLDSAFTVWKHKNGVPKVSSPLFAGGRIYMVQDGGMVTCTEAATGRLVFERERLGSDGGGEYFASPVMADGRIYLCSTRGIVTVIAAGGTLKILAQNRLDDPVASTPAIADSKLYVRSAKALWAFGE
jgi:outer membrane protein assembly factor BamB